MHDRALVGTPSIRLCVSKASTASTRIMQGPSDGTNTPGRNRVRQLGTAALQRPLNLWAARRPDPVSNPFEQGHGSKVQQQGPSNASEKRRAGVSPAWSYFGSCAPRVPRDQQERYFALCGPAVGASAHLGPSTWLLPRFAVDSCRQTSGQSLPLGGRRRCCGWLTHRGAGRTGHRREGDGHLGGRRCLAATSANDVRSPLR
jgi:hypothetical protein